MKKRTLRLAFYKNSKTLFGRGIRWKQKRNGEEFWKYSHVEIISESGYWYSSSEVDGGVRSKQINDDKGNWDYITLKVTEEEYQKVMKFMVFKLGKRYDRAGIFFAQVLGTMWFLHPEKYFCSEFCTEALQEIRMLCGMAGYSVTPARLYDLLKK